jgi:hypothetical protein
VSVDATGSHAASPRDLIAKRLGAWLRPDYQPTEMDDKIAGDIEARLCAEGFLPPKEHLDG